MRQLLGGFTSRRRASSFNWDFGPARRAELSRSDWWQSLTQRPAYEVAALLEVADSAFQQRSRLPLLGVGYALENGWRPLFVLDAEALGADPEPGLLPAEAAPPDLVRLLAADLRRYDINFGEAALLLSPRPEPVSGQATGRLVSEQGNTERVTVGVRAIRQTDAGEWLPGYLTAGHAFGRGTSSRAVVIEPKGGLRARFSALTGGRLARPFGVVSLHEAPAIPGRDGDPAGFDFAFIDAGSVDPAEWAPEPFVSRLSGPPTALEIPEPVTAYGGVSGVARAAVSGALMTGYRWRDCWLLGPTSALQPGDSGSAVVWDAAGEVAGMAVGRAVYRGQVTHLYVQSTDRLLADQLPGVRIERYPQRRFP